MFWMSLGCLEEAESGWEKLFSSSPGMFVPSTFDECQKLGQKLLFTFFAIKISFETQI